MQFIKITECFFVHYNIVQKLKNKIKKTLYKTKKIWYNIKSYKFTTKVNSLEIKLEIQYFL